MNSNEIRMREYLEEHEQTSFLEFVFDDSNHDVFGKVEKLLDNKDYSGLRQMLSGTEAENHIFWSVIESYADEVLKSKEEVPEVVERGELSFELLNGDSVQIAILFEPNANAYFAVESSYLEQEVGGLISPYNGCELKFEDEQDIGLAP